MGKILTILMFCLGLSQMAHGMTRAEIEALIDSYAAQHRLPAALVHKVVKRESNYNPSALHAGNYGLMQIKPATARTMGYRGSPKGLLDPMVNLAFGVKYLAGAYLVADGNSARAIRLYRSGYYYEAKRKGLLEEAGLKPRKKSAAIE